MLILTLHTNNPATGEKIVLLKYRKINNIILKYCS